MTGHLPARLNNTLREKMCSRCGIRFRCFEQVEETKRIEQMCICIWNVLEPNDENYPTKFGKRR